MDAAAKLPTHYDLFSADPEDPLYRLRVSTDPGCPRRDGLYTIAEENITSRSPGAQVTSIRTALDMAVEEARWLHERLGLLLEVTGEGGGGAVVSLDGSQRDEVVRERLTDQDIDDAEHAAELQGDVSQERTHDMMDRLFGEVRRARGREAQLETELAALHKVLAGAGGSHGSS